MDGKLFVNGCVVSPGYATISNLIKPDSPNVIISGGVFEKAGSVTVPGKWVISVVLGNLIADNAWIKCDEGIDILNLINQEDQRFISTTKPFIRKRLLRFKMM